MSVPLLEPCWILRAAVHPTAHNLLSADIADYEETPVRHLGWLGWVHTGLWPWQASRKSVCRKGIFQLPSILLFPSTRCLESLAFDLWLLPRIPEEYEMYQDFSEYKKETALISYSNINGLALKAPDSFQLTKPKFSPRKSKLLMLRCWNAHIQEALPNKGMATWKKSQVFLNSKT